MSGGTHNTHPRSLRGIDGNVRLTLNDGDGFDTPETYRPGCAREAQLGQAASERLRYILREANNIGLQLGSKSCGYGRYCGVLQADDVNVGDQLTLSQRVPDMQELRVAANVEIAIRWDCACDFDLAVQVWGDDPISFRTPRQASGTLFKDFTSSASLNTAWETIAMPGPVDLQAMTVAVNQFNGPTSGAEVELRIAIDGETWGRRLSFTGPADRGAGFEQTLSRRASANPAWQVVRPADPMGAN